MNLFGLMAKMESVFAPGSRRNEFLACVLDVFQSKTQKSHPVNKPGLQSAWCDELVNTKSKPKPQSPRNEFVWNDGENEICIRTTIAAE